MDLKRITELALKILAKATFQKPKMNGFEQAWDQKLARQLQTREILWYKFEAVTLKLADDTRYTVDFVVINKDGFQEMHEIKGMWRDDALVKIKVAAAMFPYKFKAFMGKKLGKGRIAFEQVDF